MIEVNLLPVREARRAADFRQQLMQLLLVVLIVMGGIGFVHSEIRERVQLSQSRVAQMQRDIDQFKPQLEQVAGFRKKKSQLEKKIGVIDDLDRARGGPVRVMSELAAKTPKRLWLVSVSTKGRKIHLKGESMDNELVAVFLRGLSDSKYFTDVDLNGTRLEGGDGDMRVVSFEITASIANPKPDDGQSEKKS
ncbi:MAG: PilN domain-containing protein [Deltaproteobacteria bacterium]|nr:PilN domain-containing protein [Deltaproteobacteria bacterium]